MRKVLCITILFLVIFSLMMFTSCNFGFQEEKITNDEFTFEKFANNILHKSDCVLLPEFISENTVGYLNSDGTVELYVFAVPINYLDEDNEYNLIDNRLDNVMDQKFRDLGYIYTIANSDVKSYYPYEISDEMGIKIIGQSEFDFGLFCDASYPTYITCNNFIGEETNMLLYDNAIKNTQLYVYPSSIGTNCEIRFKNDSDSVVTFWLDTNSEDVMLEKAGGDYLIIKNEQTNKILGVIQAPLIKSQVGDVSYHNNVTYRSRGDGKYEVVFIFDSKYIMEDSIAFISFESRKEKQVDNAIYEKTPDLVNAYLKNYSVVGNSRDLGIGQVLTRFDFSGEFNLTHYDISEANYYLYSLTKTKNSFEVISMLEEWCSITGNWNSNYKSGDTISLGRNINDNLLCFPLKTEIVKWNDDKKSEKYGIKIKAIDENNEIYDVVLSNDNTLFNNRLKIVLRNEE